MKGTQNYVNMGNSYFAQKVMGFKLIFILKKFVLVMTDSSKETSA